jgi:hypothetical protein
MMSSTLGPCSSAMQSVLISQAVVRLDGQYGNGAIVADLAGLGYVMRGKHDMGLIRWG